MSLTRVYSGKVREVFDAGDGLLMMVATDRVSAYDWVFETPVPDKGRVLTAMTDYWSAELATIAPSHLVSTDPADFPDVAGQVGDVAGRAMLVRRAEMLPLECIVRGYLVGSAWKEYRAEGTMHGTKLPEGLVEACALPEAVFTPSTKATVGHDENISFAAAEELVGSELAAKARDISLSAYARAAEISRGRGIIVADTKFELGLIDGELSICDEIVTPDSSRLWSADAWHPGETPPSFDKQPLRDWAASTGWDMESPPPQLPDEVVSATSGRYIAAYELTTGRDFSQWYGG